MKVTLTHIGAFSLGRLLAIWSFLFGLLILGLWTLFSILIAALGVAAVGAKLVDAIIGVLISFGIGVFGLIVFSVVMFIVGFITAIIYDIVLKVGGGIDLDLKERK
ncbi:hypothetical protein HZC07_04435 [Candidatus Micrarchaeota archaeon]|nr:hypothetical protein [Candidatus Micrarchaeota archaeon]